VRPPLPQPPLSLCQRTHSLPPPPPPPPARLLSARSFHEDATVGWICMLVELGFASTMIAAKGYLDYFGPRGALRSGKARGGEGSTK
jgi:hypothetical protein